jgi:DNA-binding NtrC family response regulator
MMQPTILIADNDPDWADLYQRYLGRSGCYRLLTASGGVECLPIIRHESPAVIVASVEMPWGGVDGLLDYLQQESGEEGVPFVILTGYTADENVAALRESPCVFRYLRKPFLMGRLLDYVRTIELDLRDAGRPNVSCRQRQPIAAHR